MDLETNEMEVDVERIMIRKLRLVTETIVMEEVSQFSKQISIHF